VDRAIPSHAQQLRDPSSIFPVGLYRHGGQRRFHVPRLQQNHLASGGNKAGMQLLR
jgi:hypothetical protein